MQTTCKPWKEGMHGPGELVRIAKERIQQLSALDLTSQGLDLKMEDDILVNCMQDMKSIICGIQDEPIDSNHTSGGALKELSKLIQDSNLILDLAKSLNILPFEARKSYTYIFNSLMRKDAENFCRHVAGMTDMLFDILMQKYSNPDAALSCGSMLRECIRLPDLAKVILNSDYFWLFFDVYAHSNNFEVASDAFSTMKELVTTPKHRSVAHEWLEANAERFIEKFESLLKSENYITRRRSLKLLSELLMDRGNFSLMMRYISSKDNLKTIMNLMRHKSSQIQYEAFHVFKIFVMNPHKAEDIETTLQKNRSKLIAYLIPFHSDREDELFADEKQRVIELLQEMKAPADCELDTSSPAPRGSRSGVASGGSSSSNSRGLRSAQSSPHLNSPSGSRKQSQSHYSLLSGGNTAASGSGSRKGTSAGSGKAHHIHHHHPHHPYHDGHKVSPLYDLGASSSTSERLRSTSRSSLALNSTEHSASVSAVEPALVPASFPASDITASDAGDHTLLPSSGRAAGAETETETGTLSGVSLGASAAGEDEVSTKEEIERIESPGDLDLLDYSTRPTSTADIRARTYLTSSASAPVLAPSLSAGLGTQSQAEAEATSSTVGSTSLVASGREGGRDRIPSFTSVASCSTGLFRSSDNLSLADTLGSSIGGNIGGTAAIARVGSKSLSRQSSGRISPQSHGGPLLERPEGVTPSVGLGTGENSSADKISSTPVEAQAGPGVAVEDFRKAFVK